MARISVIWPEANTVISEARGCVYIRFEIKVNG
jgi:hypothetical protein